MKLIYARHLIDRDGIPVVVGITRTGDTQILTGNPPKLVASFPIAQAGRLAQAIHDCEAFALLNL